MIYLVQDDDPDSFMNMMPHDYLKMGSMKQIEKEISCFEAMPDEELNKLFPYGKIIHTPKQCKAMYLSNSKELLRRFSIATNDKDGGAEFTLDIKFLTFFQDVIEKAGIPGSHDVTFDFKRRKCEPTMNVGRRSKRPRKYGA